MNFHRLLPLFLLFPSAAFAVNLVENSDFEQPTTSTVIPPPGWTGYAPFNAASFGTDSSIAHAGTHSACIETTADQIGVLVSNPVPVAPGETLTLSCWMRTSDLTTSSGGMISLSAGFLDRYGSYFTWKRNRFTPTAPNGEWFRVENTIVVPDRAAKVTLQAGVRFMTGKFNVDELEIVSSNTAALRFDLATASFEPGETSLPLVLIDREHTGKSFNLHGEPGGAAASVKSAGLITNLTLPFNFKKRGKNVATVRLGTADFTTSITGTVPPLLVAEPVIPTHWVIEDEGRPSLEWRAWVSEDAEARKKFTAKCELLDATGKTVATAPAQSGLSDIAVFKLALDRAASSQPTTYTARLTITDKAGKTIATADQPWRFIHADETRVTMGDDGYPRVKGKPFFPIGMYMWGNKPDLKDAGFNVVQSYSAGFTVDQGERPNNRGILQFLDNAEDAGMKALVFVNHGLATRLGREESLRRIRMFRNHPAMLVWYEEEAVARALKPLSWLAELVGDMRKEGPGHPVLIGDLVDYGVKVKDRSQMLPADLMDAGIWWWYPTPPRNAPVVEDYEGENAGPMLEYVPPSYLVQAKTKKPLWIALQCYRKPDAADARYPTPDEYRCQAYLSIAVGAKGLYYYTGYGEQGGGVFHHPEEGHWTELKALVKEMRGLEDTIMSPDAEAAKQASSTEKMLTLKTKALSNGGRFVIAVNRCNRKLTAQIQVPGLAAGAKVVECTSKQETHATSADSMSEQFNPYEVKLFQLP